MMWPTSGQHPPGPVNRAPRPDVDHDSATRRSTRRCCGSRTPGPVGTRRRVSPNPWMVMAFSGTPSAISRAWTAFARRAESPCSAFSDEERALGYASRPNLQGYSGLRLRPTLRRRPPSFFPASASHDRFPRHFSHSGSPPQGAVQHGARALKITLLNDTQP
jgi:hypothetical protein